MSSTEADTSTLSKHAPRGLKWRSSAAFVTSVVTVAMFTDLFLFGLIVPILPFALVERMGVPAKDVQVAIGWSLTSYSGSSMLMSPFFGWLSDHMSSRRGPYLVGLLALVASTTLVSTAHSLPQLLAARVLQGCSAAAVWVIGLALLLDTVGAHRLGVALGTCFSIVTIGELSGPPIGGLVYKAFGYRQVFYPAWLLLSLDIFTRFILIEKKDALKWGQDPSQVQGVDEWGNASQESAPVVPPSAATENEALVGGPTATYGSTESSSAATPTQHPLQRTHAPTRWERSFVLLPVIKHPRFLSAQNSAITQAIIGSSFSATVPQHVKSIFGFDSFAAAIIFLPLVLPSIFVGPISGAMVDRYGPRPVLVRGSLVLIPLLLLLALPGSNVPFLPRLPPPHDVSPPIAELPFFDWNLVVTARGVHVALYALILACIGTVRSTTGPPSFVEASLFVTEYAKANPGYFGPNGPFARMLGFNNVVFCGGLALGPIISTHLVEIIGYARTQIVLVVLVAWNITLASRYMTTKRQGRVVVLAQAQDVN